MATCKSLRHIFEDPRQNKSTPQTLLESLSPSWTHNPSPAEEDEPPPFNEIFGELHFRELAPNSHDNHKKTKPSFATSSSESLHLCTEGLGFESSYDVEQKEGNANAKAAVNIFKGKGDCEADGEMGRCCCCYRGEGGCRRGKWRRRRGKTEAELPAAEEEYPPPISSIGKNGKPRRNFKAYRGEGRFVLEEVRLPTTGFLRASRENGRLRMKFVQPEEEEEEEDDDDDDDDEENELFGGLNPEFLMVFADKRGRRQTFFEACINLLNRILGLLSLCL